MIALSEKNMSDLFNRLIDNSDPTQKKKEKKHIPEDIAGLFNIVSV
jgi:hypothetical protein